jgi:hypothetical protein
MRFRTVSGDEGLINGSTEKKLGWKQKIRRELIEYWINVVYLFLFFGMFTTYRRLLLARYQITYTHYGLALFEALILAKVIMIGDVLGLGRRLQDKPLALTTLFKTVVFTVWTAVFTVLEHVAEALWQGEGVTGGIHDFASNLDKVLARGLIVFFAFIPFFACKELGRVLGEKKITGLFFRRRTTTERDLPEDEIPCQP